MPFGQMCRIPQSFRNPALDSSRADPPSPPVTRLHLTCVGGEGRTTRAWNRPQGWERSRAGAQMQKIDPCHHSLESPISTPVSIQPDQIKGEGASFLATPGGEAWSQSRQDGWQPHLAENPAGALLGLTCILGLRASCSHGLWSLLCC